MVGNRSRGDASRRDSESPRREGRRQDRLGRVLGSMLGSAQTVKTNPGSQEIGGWPRDSRSHQAWGCVVTMGTGGLGISRAAAAST